MDPVRVSVFFLIWIHCLFCPNKVAICLNISPLPKVTVECFRTWEFLALYAELLVHQIACRFWVSQRCVLDVRTIVQSVKILV